MAEFSFDDDDGTDLHAVVTPPGEGCVYLESSLHEFFEHTIAGVENAENIPPIGRALMRLATMSTVLFMLRTLAHLGAGHSIEDFHRWRQRIENEARLVLRAYTLGGLSCDRANTLGATAAEAARRMQLDPTVFAMFFDPKQGFVLRDLSEEEKKLVAMGVDTMRTADSGAPVPTDAAGNDIDSIQAPPQRPLDEYLKVWLPPKGEEDKPN